MTKPLRPYSRVYWEARDDRKFVDVWADDHHLATWLRLLVIADAMWPASATLYHGVNRKSLAVLVEAKLVDILPTGGYRIHGLDRKRQVRSESARDAANTRHSGSPAGMPPEPNGTANGVRPHPVRSAEGMPSQDEPSTSRAETSRDDARGIPDGPNDARSRSNARQMAYLRGDIDEATLAEMRAADAVPVAKP